MERQVTGDAPGCEHQGKPTAPMREKLELLRSCCYLVARWILVWDKDPVSVCTIHNPTLALAVSAREIHAPTNKPKESLA